MTAQESSIVSSTRVVIGIPLSDMRVGVKGRLIHREIVSIGEKNGLLRWQELESAELVSNLRDLVHNYTIADTAIENLLRDACGADNAAQTNQVRQWIRQGANMLEVKPNMAPAILNHMHLLGTLPHCVKGLLSWSNLTDRDRLLINYIAHQQHLRNVYLESHIWLKEWLIAKRLG